MSPNPKDPSESLAKRTEPVGSCGVAAVLETVAVHVVVRPVASAAGEQAASVEVERLPANTYAAPCCPMFRTVSAGAPAAIVPRSTATELPKPAAVVVSCAGERVAAEVPSAQPPAGSVNTYAAPTETSWRGA